MSKAKVYIQHIQRGDLFPSELLCSPFPQSQYFAAGGLTEQLRNYLFKR